MANACFRYLASWVCICTSLLLSPAADAQTPIAAATISPPASIRDLTLLLQSYRPDLARVKRLRTELDTPVPAGLPPADMAVALHTKANLAEELQEVDLRIQLLKEALSYAPPLTGNGDGLVGGRQRIRSELVGALRLAQGVSVALDEGLAYAKELEPQAEQNAPWLLGAYYQIGHNYIQLGDLEKTRQYLEKMEALFAILAQRPGNTARLPLWARQVASLRAEWLMGLGRAAEAEQAYLTALKQGEEANRLQPARQARGMFVRSAQRTEATQDSDQIQLTTAYMKLNRIDEAELMLREILKRALARDGRNSVLVGKVLNQLAKVMLNRGRATEAVVLAQWAQQAMEEAGLAPLSPPRANGQVLLANALAVHGDAEQAVAIIDRLRSGLGNDARLEEGFGRGTVQTVRALAMVGRTKDALADGDQLLRSSRDNLGAQHYETAEARAYRAMVLMRMGKLDEARKEFEQASLVLLDPSKLSGKQQTNVPRTQRLKLILGEYLSLLAGRTAANQASDIARSFTLSDIARWQSVQKAVTGAALRSAAGSAELAARIKKVQDADDEIQAIYANLISQRSAPPDKQLPAVIRGMEQRLAALQKEQQADLATIRRQFPQYDALVNPRPVDAAAVHKVLYKNEALLSVYMDPQGTYVWAMGSDGKLLFHFSDKPNQWVADRVKRLRASVDLSADVAIEQMEFDVEAGADLYNELLAPVASAWSQSDTLVVVANDVLGQIPFSLLPTSLPPKPATPEAAPLSRFRDVPWLVRQVAVSYLPSVSSLVSLRALPIAQRGRDAFLGFGDPDFGTFADLGATRGAARGARNLHISRSLAWSVGNSPEIGSATSALPQVPLALSPLPDTRDEILAIAQALSADVQRDTVFGAQATPRKVVESDLQRRKVIAFATHGLVAGDLPGLEQPALALSPGPGRNIENGLLRLDQILKLSLDADLVVLSACNTAAADGAGSEAVSGLGRGFFHAGARSVLATHWPVETVSARELMTGLFAHYAKDAQLTRAQALRSSMLHMLNQGAALNADGKPELTYAHPVFWAPYALYGDPGR